MNRTELTSAAAKAAGVTKAQAESVVRALFGDQDEAGLIASEAHGNGRVQITGFGIFEGKSVKARTARNPRTGEALEIPESSKISFKPSKALKDFMNS